jgi:ATP-dependent RNA helicase HrpB
MRSGLPIDAILGAVSNALREPGNAVIVAPPGAGKSTVVPLALLEEPWARSARIVMLEPRRLAARAVAERMAATLGERAGDTVGYRMRLETRVGPRTRIEVVTEGVFTRMLQSDPALDGIAAVLFDEYHERSLHADVGLAFALDAQRHLRPALRLVAMSATIDGARVAELLRGAPVIESRGRVFPVEIRHLGKALPVLPGTDEPPHLSAARAVRRALAESPGDALVFLPGAGEIRRTQAALEEPGAPAGTDILPLYGELSPGEQDAALAPARPGRRKVVLATNIAETSLTIEGVRIVVDLGLERRNVFDPASGMSRLTTQRISRASAEQRAGRAGRTTEGVCYRLWSASAERSLAPYAAPEIAVADLAPLALDLAVWGTSANELAWLDPPPAATLAGARDLLARLGALDAAGRSTPHGRKMRAFSAHPRLAHLLLVAREHGAAGAAAEIAALLSERDVLRRGIATAAGHRERDNDIRTRLEVLRRSDTAGGTDRGALERVRRAERSFRRELGLGPNDSDTSALDTGILLGFAYPDRIAKRRAGAEARYQLASGRGAAFATPQSIGREELIVAVELDDREREAQIQLAAPLARSDLLEHFRTEIVEHEEVGWDARTEAVVARTVRRYGEIVLDERALKALPAGAAATALLEGIGALGLDSLPWSGECRNFAARCELVRKLGRGDVGEWPEFSMEVLAVDLGWLEPFLGGVTRRAQFERIPLEAALRARLTLAQLRRLDELAPTHITLPTGTRAAVDYVDDLAPCASMRMQEVFGLAATPRIGGGTVPVTFKLLSPAHRPLQVTRDLASFWRNAYVDVRKDMRGRYPRHSWPEDPLQAEPTRRAKPRPSR